MLTRLGGHPMALNPDLIEKAEATPDTVITMVDGHKLVVAESVADVVDLVREWRASVAAEAFAMSGTPAGRHPRPSLPSPVDGDPEGAPRPTGRGRSAAALAQVLRMPAREE